MSDQSPIDKAVSLAKTQTNLARLLQKQPGCERVKQQHVWWWQKKSRQCPAEYAKAIERALNGAVTAEELRPDVFGHPAETGDDPAGSAERAVGVAKTAGGRSAVAASDAREVA